MGFEGVGTPGLGGNVTNFAYENLRPESERCQTRYSWNPITVQPRRSYRIDTHTEFRDLSSPHYPFDLTPPIPTRGELPPLGRNSRSGFTRDLFPEHGPWDLSPAHFQEPDASHLLPASRAKVALPKPTLT